MNSTHRTVVVVADVGDGVHAIPEGEEAFEGGELEEGTCKSPIAPDRLEDTAVERLALPRPY